MRGDGCELWYQDGWWEVKFLARERGKLSVLSEQYHITHSVSASALRPGWKRAAGEWACVLGGKQLATEAAPAQLARNAPLLRARDPAEA